MRQCAALLLGLAVGFAGNAWAAQRRAAGPEPQGPLPPVFSPPRPLQVAASPLGNCSKVSNLSDYKIRSASLEDPFRFLPWRKPSDGLTDEIKGLQTQSYSFNLVNAVSKDIEKESWLDDTVDTRASFNYADIV